MVSLATTWHTEEVHLYFLRNECMYERINETISSQTNKHIKKRKWSKSELGKVL